MRRNRSVGGSVFVVAVMAALLPVGVVEAQSPSTGPSAGPATDPAEVCAPFRADDVAAVPGAGRALAMLGADTTTDPYACRLPGWTAGPAWPFAGTVDLENAFHWADADAESVEPQGEILGVGWAPIVLTRGDARKLIRSKAWATRGDAAKAIRAGRYLLVQIETAEEPTPLAGRTLSFHLGTDRRGDPSNNTPASTAAPENPYQDLQDVYTLFLTEGSRDPALYTTDFAAPPLANGSPWYNATTPFAARVIADPPGVQFLVPERSMGTTFRPVAFTDLEAQAGRGLLAAIGGGDGPVPGTFDQGSDVPVVPSGSDFGAIGTKLGLFPRNGIADAMVGCLEADTVHVAETVEELFIDGTKVDDPTLPSQTPLIWCTWPTFADGDVLAQWFNFADADGDGVTLVPATLVVKEAIWDAQAGRTRSRELRQVTNVRVTLRGGNLYVGAVIGLGSYGYHDLLGIELGSTLNEDADRILKRSAAAALAVLPPWSVDETQGWTAGDATCLPDDVRAPLGLPPR